MSQSITGILLAAGRSRRFGADKRRAALEEAPLIVHAACALQTALHDTLIVLGADDVTLEAELSSLGFSVTCAPDAALGMGHSLAHGVAQRPDASGWLIALADMPAIRPDTIQTLADELATPSSIVAPYYLGQRGHPVGFGRAYYAELAALTGDAGARPVLQAHANCVIRVDVDDAGVLVDVDTPADLKRLSSG
ncbi:nucleotidyltransferase family protein [Crenobacter cavernae]|uniref:Nucleotidyltransferase family protein n=1 Tax=Crenobacter cavernae TaxID=2290923 RepID=A0ABY0F9G0_9NEIS|nr:nucleotidyltransferase family protein [Crenobacter cavernae]RXZ42115.1 nucleotidyltransferase family protein [Crenobacter cavernae]